MNINIRGEKLNITDSMKNYAEEKLQRLSKYLDNQESIVGNLLFKINGPKQKVEVTIPLKNFTLRVEEEGTDFYATIDVAVDKLQRQIIKNKTRLESKKMREKQDFIFNDIDEDYNIEENESKIVKRKLIELKPMDEEEAILQMELLNHDFYIFRNADTNKASIIYKRKNDDYGLIEGE